MIHRFTYCILIGLTAFSLHAFSQTVSIVNKRFVVNGNSNTPIYFNGANTPWEAWNDFGGSFNQAKWLQDMQNLNASGINAARIWFSCNGDGQPKVSATGIVSAPTQAFWDNCDLLFEYARENGVYIMATMMSFDHTKSVNNYSGNWQKMMNDTATIRTYLNNYLIPFVNRYKGNPYLWSIDICNEIEWIAENGSTTGNDKNWGCSYATLQRFVAMCCVPMHSAGVERSDGSRVLVTLGSAATKWNATMKRNKSFGTGWVTNSDGNKWSDASLQSVYSNSKAFLDFYSPHFYGWINAWFYNPFEKSPADYGIDEKPCMIGEMPSKDPFPIPNSLLSSTNMSQSTAFANLKTLGWQGHMPWTANLTNNLTSEVGTLADFGAAALTFKNANASLVYPSYIALQTNALQIGNAQNSSAELALYSNIGWTVSCNESWLTVNNTSGTGMSNLTLTATANHGNSSRKAIVTFSGNGVNEVTLTVTQSDSVTGTTIIRDAGIVVYPNPVSNKLYISVKKPFAKANVTIYRYDTIEVYKTDITANTNAIDLSSLPKGLYIVKIVSKDFSTFVTKIEK